MSKFFTRILLSLPTFQSAENDDLHHTLWFKYNVHKTPECPPGFLLVERYTHESHTVELHLTTTREIRIPAENIG